MMEKMERMTREKTTKIKHHLPKPSTFYSLFCFSTHVREQRFYFFF